ncbi:MAG TPA: serine hydrolase domain-containing protein [Pyrinomonadaceae bacterium]|nr:serine hydrolase domain-containing protein [Pyrinomonadaceae bacterium]
MILKRFSHLLVVTTLLIAVTLAPFQNRAQAQEARPQTVAAATQTATTDLRARLAAIERAIDEKRKEYHIPGLSFVIVKDDHVIYMKGLGLRDVEHNQMVTPDTLFAIGSSSKAFTAMAAAMAADEGKLSLDDSPKKFLPYFRLRDADADARITIRDLLSHRSGIDRTDLSMVTGKLNREELIRVAGMAKPTARLGEKFLYQNIMFTAAGEIVARAQNTTWNAFIEKRIFKPLGMKASNTTVAATLKSPDYALGYSYNTETKETTHVPMREIEAAAPAGAINSNARDMAQWLRLMLSSGVFEGKRLVSEKNFKELTSVQNKIAGNVNYGLGWFLREWNNHKVVEHGGNIDGFNALVAMMPDQRLGFVMLTNISGSPLGAFAMETVWSNLVGAPEINLVKSDVPASDPSAEVGQYLLAEASINFDVELKDGKLTLSVPGQPEYQLENVGGRRYKLTNAPAGFFVTFRPVKEKQSETEMFLEQPQGNLVAARVKAKATAPADSAKSAPDQATANYDGPLKDLLGAYEMTGAQSAEVKVVDGKVSFVVAGQRAFPLVEREKDKLYSTNLPDTYSITVKRDAAGRVTGLLMKQPEGEFELTRVAERGVSLTVDELLARMVAAQGGEENLRRHKSRIVTTEVDMEHQGIKGSGVTSARAPNALATHIDLTALGKKIGTIDEYFDGTEGGEVSSFSPGETKAGKSLEDARISSDFYGALNWKKLFQTIEIKRMSKIGDEDVFVVVKTPEKGNPVTDYVSAKSYLVLRRETVQTSNTSQISLPVTEVFADYRAVEGLMIPHKTTTSIPSIGDIVTTVKEIKFDVAIPDAVFHVPDIKQ